MNYMSTACITLKMMKLFSYADFQKASRLHCLCRPGKSAPPKYSLMTKNIRVKVLSNSEYIITIRKITGTHGEQLNYLLSGCARSLLAEKEYLVLIS
jgi:hypothetical protein